MPNIKSAEKRVAVAKAKTLRNRMIKSDLKTAVKKFEKVLLNNDTELARRLYSEVVKKVDMAASKGVIHKNVANRKKSKLALRLNAASEN